MSHRPRFTQVRSSDVREWRWLDAIAAREQVNRTASRLIRGDESRAPDQLAAAAGVAERLAADLRTIA